MTVTVNPSSGGLNTHHIKLTDYNSTEIGLITVDGYGDKKAQVSVSPYPNMASQLRMGKSRYADRVPPFEDIAQDDFSGGIAMLHHDEDGSRYLEGKRIDTSRGGEVVLGPQESYTKGLRDFNENWSKDANWQALYKDGTESLEDTFTVDALDDTNYTAESVVLLLKKVGSPTGSITATLSDTDGANAVTKSLSINTDCLDDLESERVEFVFTSTKTLSHTSSYKIKVAYDDVSSDSDNYISVAIDDDDDLHFRVLDDSGPIGGIFFEYLDGLYLVTQPEDRSASTLYLLGDRGVAGDNAGALSTLVDSTKSWATNEWAGAVVKILGDSKEETPYRTVVSNTSDTLTVDEAYTKVHTNSTRYVIMGNKWTSQQVLGGYCYTAESYNEKVFFGFGYPTSVNEYVYRWREYADSVLGTWVTDYSREENAGWGASVLKAQRVPLQFGRDHSVTGKLWVWSESSGTWPYIYDFDIAYRDADNSKILTTIFENNRAWSDTVYGTTAYDMSPDGSTKVSIQDAFGTGKVAHVKLDEPVDIRHGQAMLITYRQSGSYTGNGDLQIILADADGNEDAYNLYPNATVSGSTIGKQAQYLYLDTPGTESVDPSAITDIYLNVAVDQGAADISFSGPLLLTTDRNWFAGTSIGGYYRDLPHATRCNGIELYTGGAGEISEKPWFLCDRGVFYIENGYVKKIPLGELEEMRHYRSGEGHCVNDVYMIWNHGETVQSYYAGQLKSIGPDIDYGLPQERRGIPCSMASYPGRVYAAWDAGDSGVSHILYRRNHGWHEAYRAWGNERITEIIIQGRAEEPDRLYFIEGGDVGWFHVSNNPFTESGYKYTHEGTIETARIYGGLRETEKFYHGISLVTESLSDGHRWIEVDYRTSENQTYTTVGEGFITSPRQRKGLSPSNDVIGRWIQFRIRFYSDDEDETPKLNSMILDSLERLDSANTYVYNVRLKEDYDMDLQGTEEDKTGVEKWSQIQTWVGDPRPLTLNSTSGFENGKLVFIEPERSRVLYSKVDDVGQEVRIYQLTLIEVK